MVSLIAQLVVSVAARRWRLEDACFSNCKQIMLLAEVNWKSVVILNWNVISTIII